MFRHIRGPELLLWSNNRHCDRTPNVVLVGFDLTDLRTVNICYRSKSHISDALITFTVPVIELQKRSDTTTAPDVSTTRVRPILRVDLLMQIKHYTEKVSRHQSKSNWLIYLFFLVCDICLSSHCAMANVERTQLWRALYLSVMYPLSERTRKSSEPQNNDMVNPSKNTIVSWVITMRLTSPEYRVMDTLVCGVARQLILIRLLYTPYFTRFVAILYPILLWLIYLLGYSLITVFHLYNMFPSCWSCLSAYDADFGSRETVTWLLLHNRCCIWNPQVKTCSSQTRTIDFDMNRTQDRTKYPY